MQLATSGGSVLVYSIKVSGQQDSVSITQSESASQTCEDVTGPVCMVSPTADLDTSAKSLKEILLSTAEQILVRQRKKIQPWVTNEVLDLRDQRRS